VNIIAANMRVASFILNSFINIKNIKHNHKFED
jgi:hypothetical protein